QLPFGAERSRRDYFYSRARAEGLAPVRLRAGFVHGEAAIRKDQLLRSRSAHRRGELGIWLRWQDQGRRLRRDRAPTPDRRSDPRDLPAPLKRESDRA